ncbi:hypothetical protein FQN60_011343 [Etheostoma spectabile]|uniref:Uncharacterized protein n=1 Tax=Etheostoma spectabile TaxID=54343 RepID=A0A5J5DRY5_9PERO|nr:hypothetical protein FQN60_011343 [Etheostoma spectabile]
MDISERAYIYNVIRTVKDYVAERSFPTQSEFAFHHASTASPAKGSEPKVSEAVSHLCTASCGAFISGRDPYPMCIACMVAKDAYAVLADWVNARKILERQLRVAVANSDDPCLSETTLKVTTSTYQPQATPSWADMMDEETPDMPPFQDLLEVEPGCEDAEGNAISDLLDMDRMEDEENSTFPVQQSRPPSL